MYGGEQLTREIDIDQLLLTKKLDPISDEHHAKLDKISKIEVANFSEMEVRSYVIDPIVRILGYDKGTIFSTELEHSITFLGKHIFPDYKLTLWNENSWLIEAKRPRSSKTAFEYAELRQEVEYSVHPSINAALIVLCDGIKLE